MHRLSLSHSILIRNSGGQRLETTGHDTRRKGNKHLADEVSADQQQEAVLPKGEAGCPRVGGEDTLPEFWAGLLTDHDEDDGDKPSSQGLRHEGREQPVQQVGATLIGSLASFSAPKSLSISPKTIAASARATKGAAMALMRFGDTYFLILLDFLTALLAEGLVTFLGWLLTARLDVEGREIRGLGWTRVNG